MYRVDSELGLAILRLSSTRGIGDAKLSSAINASIDTGAVSIDRLFQYSYDEFGLDLSTSKNFEQEELIVDQLSEAGVHFCLNNIAGYPKKIKKRIGNSGPPVLYLYGNTKLLRRESVGYCGSRDATSEAIQFAINSTNSFVQSDWVVVSGYAKGIDTAAHYSALDSGGKTIVVLAEGIARFKVKKEYADVWDIERVCVVSQFSPRMTWSAGNAMKRNRTIAALSDLMIVAQAGDTGGSLAAGIDSIKMSVPVAMPRSVYEHTESQGMSKLLALGAKFINDVKYPEVNVNAIRQWIDSQPESHLF